MASCQGENLFLSLLVSWHVLLQVKKIMNQVFQSLRGEFDLEESYIGREVLGIVMNTIKVELIHKIPYQEQPHSVTHKLSMLS